MRPYDLHRAINPIVRQWWSGKAIVGSHFSVKSRIYQQILDANLKPRPDETSMGKGRKAIQ
jgi:hypothetical protein